MSANTYPIYPITPYLGIADLSAVTACTTRAPTATAGLAAANISRFIDPNAATNLNGRRIDKIKVQASSSAIGAPTAVQLVGIWIWDGTKAYLIDEIAVTLVTPSATVACYTGEKSYTTLVLPVGYDLYASTTVTTTASTTALTVIAEGGSY